jgi:hypothetical protein
MDVGMGFLSTDGIDDGLELIDIIFTFDTERNDTIRGVIPRIASLLWLHGQQKERRKILRLPQRTSRLLHLVLNGRTIHYDLILHIDP